MREYNNYHLKDKKGCGGGWRDASVDKNTFFFFQRTWDWFPVPTLSFTFITPVPGMQGLPLTSTDIRHDHGIHTYMQANSHTYKVK